MRLYGAETKKCLCIHVMEINLRVARKHERILRKVLKHRARQAAQSEVRERMSESFNDLL